MKAREYLAKKIKAKKVLFVRCDEHLYNKVETQRLAAGLTKNKFMLAAVEYFLDNTNLKKAKKSSCK